MKKVLFVPIVAMLLLAPVVAFAENANVQTLEAVIASGNAAPSTAIAVKNAAVPAHTVMALGNAETITANVNDVAIAFTKNANAAVVHALLESTVVVARGDTILLATNHEASLSQANSAANASSTFIREAQPAFTAPNTKALSNSSTLVAMTATGHTEGGFAANTAAENVPIRA